MNTQILKKPAIITVMLVALMHSGCKKNESPIYQVKLSTSMSLGQYLVDRSGYTLYMFANDYKGRTSCTGGCASLWPYFYVSGLTQSQLGSGLDIADFDTIMVNGTAQLRYRTWPLYYYAPAGYSSNVREPAGQTNGDGFNNVWFVAKPDYSIMYANAQLVGTDGKNYTGSFVEGIAKTVYFTDGKGVTLYRFSKDSLNINKFTNVDFSNNSTWPIYEASLLSVPSNLDKSLFGTINVHGRTQITYKGWPLYFFGQDNLTRGNNKGISFPAPGIWPVAEKDMLAAPGK